jgi:hypothetical protein
MLQLKSIKYCDFASEETLCYQANVYWKGKRIGSVSNDGHGGCDYERRDPEHKEAWAELDAYVAEQPTETWEFGGTDVERSVTFDDLCNRILVEHLERQDVRKEFTRAKKWWSFFVGEWAEDGSYRTVKKTATRRQFDGYIEQTYPTEKVTVINDLTFDAFYALTKGGAQ